MWNARAWALMCVRAWAGARAGMGARAPAYLLFPEVFVALPGARYVYNGRLVREGDGTRAYAQGGLTMFKVLMVGRGGSVVCLGAGPFLADSRRGLDSSGPGRWPTAY